MITKIKVNNCFAFNKEVEMNLRADMRTKRFISNIIHTNNVDVLKSTVLYGPNNTGKTSFINCIKEIKKTLLNSKSFLESNIFNKDSICELGISFIYKSKEYNYEYKYDDKIKEYIYEKMSEIKKDNYNNEKEEIIFLKDNKKNKFECSLDKNLEKVLSITSNSNILIYTIQTEKFEILKKIKEILTTTANNIEIISMNNLPISKTIQILKTSPEKSKKIVEFIKNADIYLENFKYNEEIQLPEKFIEENEPKYHNLQEQIKLTSVYKGIEVPSIFYDSLGTKKISALASYIIEAIEEGKTLIVDELDSSLHFKITRAIIGMFNNEINKKAQLIVTLHDISLLDCKKMFRKEQIWFTSKDEDGTNLYSLKEFSYEKDGIRDTTDIIEKYSKGFFGAIPEPDLIETLISSDEDM